MTIFRTAKRLLAVEGPNADAPVGKRARIVKVPVPVDNLMVLVGECLQWAKDGLLCCGSSCYEVKSKLLQYLSRRANSHR